MAPRITFISWAPYCSRSDNIARELGGTSHMIYWRALGSSPATVWLKYLGQTVRTWATLWRERPAAVFVMAPPIVAALPVWAYCRLAGIPFVIDAHTAAFLHPRWQRLQWLQHAMSRRAATTIVTNEHLAEQLTAAGADVTIVRDVPVEFPSGGDFATSGTFCVAVICSFNDDEPVAEMVAAAAALPDVTFYVTGESKRVDPALADKLPANMNFTGFIPDAAYGSLLKKADVVLTLTTRNHTMLRGAYEAIYQGTPVIVSDWPLLRSAFDRGAIHVDNRSGSIAAAIETMRRERDAYRVGAAELRQHKRFVWSQTGARLLRCLFPQVQKSVPSSL